MKKKIISTVLSAAMLASACAGLMPTAYAAANTPKYQTTARQMEYLNRGLIAVKTTADSRGQAVNGVYLSWRLLGTESLENQAFDIYRNGVKIKTTGAHDATCYVDTSGNATSSYKVVKAGASAQEVEREKAVTPIAINYTAKESEVGNGNSEKNSFTYVDIPLVRPEPVARMGDGKTSYYYNVGEAEGGANDASVGDLDGDGEYEIVLKWDPTDSKDSAGADFTGNVYIDAYEIDPNNNGYKWRIDLGKNVTAGQHYSQFIVFDFDGDGKSEIAVQTAPGTIDGTGRYVSEVGDTAEIRNIDNTASYVGTSGNTKGRNIGPEYYTIFDGETGAALCTTAAIPLGTSSEWGDSKYNRASRFLAGVAYLDGVTPSLLMCRGYYDKAVIRAYSWDGEAMNMTWEYNSGSNGVADNSLYGQGNHNLSIADIDNDGKDEIVYGSASLDDDGKTVLGNTKHSHGDAMHVNDFNNDGIQEVFSVKEEKAGYANNAANFRVASTGKTIWGKGASGDTGRGVMANIDDTYAAANPNGLALAWSSSHANLFDLAGSEVAAKPTAGSRSMDNFLVWWDGDLGREILDDTIIGKYSVANGGMKRFYASDGYSLTGSSSNNYTKRTPSLVADIWGDWREEVIMSLGKGEADSPALRVFTSTLPTTYRMTTLMHDSQYRCAIAWQNVAYNQPPHTSYYVGSAALATDANGNKLNYLAPAVAYTKVDEAVPEFIKVQMYSSKGFNSGAAGFTGGTVKDGVLSGTATNNLGLTANSNKKYLFRDIDMDYMTIKSISVDGKNAALAYENLTDASYSATVICAAYDAAGNLTSMVPTEVTVEPQTTDTITLPIEGENVKAMLWEDVKSMVPVTAAATAKNEVKDVKLPAGESTAVEVEFDWLPGTDVQLLAADGTNLITFAKKSDSAMTYATGDAAANVIDSSLTADEAWYHVIAKIDSSSKTAVVSVKDTTNNKKTVTLGPVLIESTGSLFDKIVVTDSSIDDVTVSKLESSKESTLVEFTVYDSEGKLAPDALITVGEQTTVTDANGRARMKIAKGEYNYTAKSAGSRTTRGTLNTSDTSAEIQLGVLQMKDVYLTYKYGNVELKPAEVIGKALETSTYAPEIDDSKKVDIPYEVNGKTVMLEYDPDNSNTEVVVSEIGTTELVLKFVPKRVPLDGEKEIANIYISKDGTGKGTAWNVPTDAAFKKDASGIKYVEFTDNGTNPLTVQFDNTETKLVMEFDIMMNAMDTGGAVFGAVPYSGDTKGTGAGWRVDSNGRFEPARTANNGWLTTEGDYKAASNYQNKWTHIIMVCNDGNITVTFVNKDTGTVFAKNQLIDSGLGTKPINKVVFGRGYGGGSGTMGVRNFKAYTVNVDAELTEETKEIDVPGTTSFKVDTVHKSNVDGITYDASPIVGTITYELQDMDGNVADEVAGLTLNGNGELTATDDLDTSKQYKVVVKLNGFDWYIYTLTYRSKQLITKTQDFADGLNGFAITSKDGYAVAHEDGMVKYTKTAGTNYDSNVHLTYPITTTNLGDDYEVSFDFMINSAAFKGYMYFRNNDSNGAEIMRMETHLYTPRFKVPATSEEGAETTTDFNQNNGFEFSKWYTFVLGCKNGTQTINIYDKEDVNRETPLVTTQYAVKVAASAGIKFDYQVAQNLQNGSVDNADEYYFDNFTYSYYDYK